MFKKTLTIFTLAICGLTSLQATSASPFSQEIEINQETEQDQLDTCCGKRKHRKNKRKRASVAIEETLACKRCKGKHLA